MRRGRSRLPNCGAKGLASPEGGYGWDCRKGRVANAELHMSRAGAILVTKDNPTGGQWAAGWASSGHPSPMLSLAALVDHLERR